MGIFDFLRKKDTSELFNEAVNRNDYLNIVKYGRKLLSEQSSPFIVNSVADAYAKLNQKTEAARVLRQFGEEKLRDDYYKVAIALFSKALNLTPLDLSTAVDLSKAYEKQGLYWEAFSVLRDIFERYQKAGKDTSKIESIIERFVEKKPYPVFYEYLADMAVDKQKAFEDYTIAANMYVNIKDLKSALRCFLKARKIEATKSVDTQIVNILANLPDSHRILLPILKARKDDVDFIAYVVNVFLKKQKADVLLELSNSINQAGLKYVLLSLVASAENRVDDATSYIERLKLINGNLAAKLTGILISQHPEASSALSNLETKPIEEALPEPTEVLSALDKAIDVSTEGAKFADELIDDKAKQRINEELKGNTEGLKYISLAEAMFGLGNYDKAIEDARRALKFKDVRAKAVLTIGESLKLKGEYKKAIDFLLNELEKGNFTKQERKDIEELVEEIKKSWK